MASAKAKRDRRTDRKMDEVIPKWGSASLVPQKLDYITSVTWFGPDFCLYLFFISSLYSLYMSWYLCDGGGRSSGQGAFVPRRRLQVNIQATVCNVATSENNRWMCFANDI